MKKLLLTTAVILGLASCEIKTVVEDYRAQEKLPTPYIKYFEHKGHDYILFMTAGGYASVGGVVHDPDCKCKTDKEEQPWEEN